jgi:hypothetical protein
LVNLREEASHNSCSDEYGEDGILELPQKNLNNVKTLAGQLVGTVLLEALPCLLLG